VAAQNGKVYVVMMMADAGADLHAENAQGETPLDVAARYKNGDVASFLLNADRSIISSTRSLREAAKAGQGAIVRLLLDMGMDVGACDGDTKDTALHEAVRYLKVEVAEILLGYVCCSCELLPSPTPPLSLLTACSPE